MIFPQGYQDISIVVGNTTQVISILVDYKKKRILVWDEPKMAALHNRNSFAKNAEIPKEALPIAEVKIGKKFIYQGQDIFRLTRFIALSRAEAMGFAGNNALLAKSITKGVELEMFAQTVSR